jgi:protein-L-isoaspartate(D-aspartate) O-methyltransferase
MTISLEDARHFYADELQFVTRMRSPDLKAAFASVPRESFVGPGPWRIKSPWELGEYWTTPDADPRHVYHDVLIALDEQRRINNGQPSLWAYQFDKLAIRPGEEIIHLGCGTGYYTAIMAQLTGSTGKVLAIELQPELATRARAALLPWSHVDVQNSDGSAASLPMADVIVASAGATHPPRLWLDAIRIGGRLLFPLTTTHGPGSMLLATRRTETVFAARFLSSVSFIDFAGARDAGESGRLLAALRRDRGAGVRSLRCDSHAEEKTCWLHGEGWCLSCTPPEDAA